MAEQDPARKTRVGGWLNVSWYKGLYGRIALGYLISIAFVLAVQAMVFVKLADRRDQSSDADRLSRQRVTQEVARNLSQALETSPQRNLDDALSAIESSEYVGVVMRDGRVSGDRLPGPATIRSVVVGLQRLAESDPFPEAWTNSELSAAPVVVHGRIVGALGFVPRSFFERYGAAIVGLELALLLLGIVFLSLVIVGPIRARLGNLDRAAAQLRDGDLTARAREDGGDELAEVSRGFNEMARKLSARTTAMETSDRLRRQLIADVSHELMTPLTAVLGHLETLTMPEVQLDSQERLNQIEIAAGEARRLERLIGDLLDTARLEAGGIELQLQDVAVAELFERICLRHDHECRTRAIRLMATVSPGLSTFRADPFRIEQAIENVVTNAFRHTPDGKLIELRASANVTSVLIQVWDSGSGIGPAHLPFIFDRFYKASSADGIASPGSGLGLAIVKAIVNRHGGQVSARSTIGSGTIVTIELPRRR